MLRRLVAIGMSGALVLAITSCKKDDAKPAAEAANKAKPAAAPQAAPAAKPAAEAKAAPQAAPAAKPEAGPAAPTAAKPATAPAAAKPAAQPGDSDAAAVKAAGGSEVAQAATAAKPAPAAEKDAATKAREEMEARRKRIQEIYTLGRSKEDSDAAKLKAIIIGEGPVYERASAIRALGRDKRENVIPDLKKLVDDKATAVRIEAAIKLYQWGEQRFAMPVLKKLRTQGVALRRAFQTGFDKGKPTYDKNALPFFNEGVKAENVYVRLDSAVGLIEVEKENKGLPVIKSVITGEEKYHIRMAAVNYLTPLKTNEKVRGLLELAAKDKDERVAKRARDVLGVAAPKKAAPAPAKASDGDATKPVVKPTGKQP